MEYKWSRCKNCQKRKKNWLLVLIDNSKGTPVKIKIHHPHKVFSGTCGRTIKLKSKSRLKTN